MKSIVMLCLLAVLCVAQGCATAGSSADIVFKNGNIYTVDEKLPHAEAIAIKQGKIIFVGSNADVAKYEGGGAQVIDLGSKTVLPGLTDAHCHLSGVGAREMNLNLEGTASLDDFLTKVKARVDQAKPGIWVTGRGWIETPWKPQTFPTRWDLDKVSPDNPVVLVRADGHGNDGRSSCVDRTPGIITSKNALNDNGALPTIAYPSQIFPCDRRLSQSRADID